MKVGGETSSSVNKTESEGFQPTSMKPLLSLSLRTRRFSNRVFQPGRRSVCPVNLVRTQFFWREMKRGDADEAKAASSEGINDLKGTN